MTDAELHAPGRPPRIFTLGAVYRVLRLGYHRPLVCHLEDEGEPAGTWVVKPWVPDRNRSPCGQLMALCELASSEVCARVSIPTPAIGLVRLPEYDVDLSMLEPEDRPLAAEVLAANRGALAFCSRRLERAIDLIPTVLRTKRRYRAALRTVGVRMLLLDAYIRNPDRCVANPNALLWRGDLVAIDHGQAFVNIESTDDASAQARLPSPVFQPREHVVFSQLRDERSRMELDTSVFQAGIEQFSDADVEAMASAWPAELDRPIAGGNNTYKIRIVSFLKHRRAAAEVLSRELMNALVR